MLKYVPDAFRQYDYILCFKENKTKNYQKTLTMLNNITHENISVDNELWHICGFFKDFTDFGKLCELSSLISTKYVFLYVGSKSFYHKQLFMIHQCAKERLLKDETHCINKHEIHHIKQYNTMQNIIKLLGIKSKPHVTIFYENLPCQYAIPTGNKENINNLNVDYFLKENESDDSFLLCPFFNPNLYKITQEKLTT